jgi:single-strand DNA-binding protein
VVIVLNRIVVQGRFTDDVELKKTDSGLSVCSFTIATDDGYGDKKKTYFLNGVAWRGLAETICKFCKKGAMIILDGKLTTRKYTDKDSNKRTAFEILADNVFFCESKKPDPVGDLVNNAKAAGIDTNFVNSENDFSVVPGDDDLPF